MLKKVWNAFNQMVDARRAFAPALLRYSVAAIFLWFGIEQIVHTDAWTYLIPDALINTFHISAATFVFANGCMEVVLALLLVLGIGTRIAALILAVHLFNILPVVGYSATSVRDFGLAMAALVVFLNGADKYTLDYRWAVGSSRDSNGVHIIN